MHNNYIATYKDESREQVNLPTPVRMIWGILLNDNDVNMHAIMNILGMYNVLVSGL